MQESNLYIHHYVYRQHSLTTQVSTPATATPINIELIEEDDVLSLVETDNTHIIIYTEV